MVCQRLTCNRAAKTKPAGNVEAETTAGGLRRSFSRPRIRLDRNRPIVPFDPDTPATCSVAARQWIGADLVNVIATRLARSDYEFDRLDLVDVDGRP